MRERIYSTRKDIKNITRQEILGPDGYSFTICSKNASKQVKDAAAGSNRALVEVLVSKSAFTYTVSRQYFILLFLISTYLRILRIEASKAACTCIPASRLSSRRHVLMACFPMASSIRISLTTISLSHTTSRTKILSTPLPSLWLRWPSSLQRYRLLSFLFHHGSPRASDRCSHHGMV